MSVVLPISGFADEIAPELDTQLAVVSRLGMRQICVRAADGHGVADMTAAGFEADLLPRLRAAGVGVSSLGSPIGKIGVRDDAAFADQLQRLDELCRIAALVGTRLIRVFAFFVHEEPDADACADVVIAKMRQFVEVAARHDCVLILENEKHIFGDIGRRCDLVLRAIDSPHLRAAFDFANFVQCGEDTMACWALLRDRVADIHIKDARYGDGRNVVCGTGDGQIRDILADAIARGYRGPLTLEPHLALFGTLSSLEIGDVTDTVGAEGVADGAQGFAVQLRALTTILTGIGASTDCAADGG